MMRSLFSGVSGLKTHQTKMDVIGNNIANVNTTSYKSASITFSDIMYQTTQNASGPNAATGRAGVNARQIGLGVQSAAISNSITTAGATQTTGNPFDIKINGDAFFVVSDGTQNFFTRDGSFYVDGVGNLAMSSNGYNVMGWGVDEETGTVLKREVQALRIMSEANMTYPPEATTEAYVAGILDKNEPDAKTEGGKLININFFDALGYSYTAKFAVKDTSETGKYTVSLADIVNENGVSITEEYNVTSLEDIISFGGVKTESSSQIYQLASNAKYDWIDPADHDQGKGYFLTKAPLENLSDYQSTKIKGVSYETGLVVDESGAYVSGIPNGKYVKDGDVVSGTIDPDAGVENFGKVVLVGTGTVTKDNMEEFNHLYFDAKTGEYYKPGSADGVPAEKLNVYKIDAEGKETTEIDKGPTIIRWEEALGLVKLDDDGNPDETTRVGSLTEVPNVDASGNVTFKVKQTFSVGENSTYSDGSFKTEQLTGDKIIQAYGLENGNGNNYVIKEVAEDGRALIERQETYEGYVLKFDENTGKFSYIGSANNSAVTLDFNDSCRDMEGNTIQLGNFADINVDWSNVNWFNNNGSSTVSGSAGLEASDGTRPAGYGKGRKNGEMSGVSIQNNGMIYASYDNGMTKLLGQIAVAEFANASGLEKVGDNLYSATLNSGDFDGIGSDITANGGSMATGALEMSNVDLSSEFTSMITTQRGFQANSRIITVSDTLLEELVNLKR